MWRFLPRECGLLALSVMLALSPEKAGCSVSVEHNWIYFSVNGVDQSSVLSSLQDAAVARNVRTAANTDWSMSWRFDYNKNSGCRLENIRVSVEITTHFPRFPEIENLGDENPYIDVIALYGKRLRTHENFHADITSTGAHLLKDLLSKLPPMANCEELDEKANRVGYDIIRKTRDINATYDQATGQGRFEGAIFPKDEPSLGSRPDYLRSGMPSVQWADIECDNRPFLKGRVDGQMALAVLDSGSSVATLSSSLADASLSTKVASPVSLITGSAKSMRLDNDITFTSNRHKFILERPLVFDARASSSCARSRPDVIMPASTFAEFDLYYRPGSGYSLLSAGAVADFETTQTLQLGLSREGFPFVVAAIADNIVLLEIDTGAKSDLHLPEDFLGKEGVTSSHEHAAAFIRLGKTFFQIRDSRTVTAEIARTWRNRGFSGLLGSDILTRCEFQLSVESRLLSLGTCVE